MDLATAPVLAKSVFTGKVTLDLTHRYIRVEPILTDADFIAGQTIQIKTEWLDPNGKVIRTENDTLLTGSLGTGEHPALLWCDNDKQAYISGASVQFTASCKQAIMLALRITASADIPTMPLCRSVPVNNPIPYPSKVDVFEATTQPLTTVAPAIQANSV